MLLYTQIKVARAQKVTANELIQKVGSEKLISYSNEIWLSPFCEGLTYGGRIRNARVLRSAVARILLTQIFCAELQVHSTQQSLYFLIVTIMASNTPVVELKGSKWQVVSITSFPHSG